MAPPNSTARREWMPIMRSFADSHRSQRDISDTMAEAFSWHRAQRQQMSRTVAGPVGDDWVTIQPTGEAHGYVQLSRYVEPTGYAEPTRYVQPARYAEPARRAEPSRYTRAAQPAFGW